MRKAKRRKVAGQYDKESSGIGFDQWGLAQDKIQEFGDECEEFFANLGLRLYKRIPEIIAESVAEGLKLAITEPCYAWLKFDASKDDPVSVVVELPIGPDEISSPRWSFSLRDVVKDAVDSCVEGGEDDVETATADGIWLASIRDEFRKMANEIDSNLITEPAKEGGSQ